MDIITAIIVSVMLTLVSAVVTRETRTRVIGEHTRGRLIFWVTAVVTVAINVLIYHASPQWLAWALAGATGGAVIWNARQAARLARDIARAEARAEAALLAARRRAKLAEARSALQRGMPERAKRLSCQARDLT